MSKFDEAIAEMKRKREQTIEEIAVFVEAEAKQRVKVKTGELRRKITHVTEHGDEVSRAKVGSNLEYTQTLEEGSSPHTIRSNDGKPLRFKINGNWVVVDQVNHPGTRAQPFLLPSITENTGEIQDRIKRGLSTGD
jgi:hypothetical protein